MDIYILNLEISELKQVTNDNKLIIVVEQYSTTTTIINYLT